MIKAHRAKITACLLTQAPGIHTYVCTSELGNYVSEHFVLNMWVRAHLTSATWAASSNPCFAHHLAPAWVSRTKISVGEAQESASSTRSSMLKMWPPARENGRREMQTAGPAADFQIRAWILTTVSTYTSVWNSLPRVILIYNFIFFLIRKYYSIHRLGGKPRMLAPFPDGTWLFSLFSAVLPRARNLYCPLRALHLTLCTMSKLRTVVLNRCNAVILWWGSSCCGDLKPSNHLLCYFVTVILLEFLNCNANNWYSTPEGILTHGLRVTGLEGGLGSDWVIFVHKELEERPKLG